MKQTKLFEFDERIDLMCRSCALGLINPCHSEEARIACYEQSIMSAAKQILQLKEVVQ